MVSLDLLKNHFIFFRIHNLFGLLFLNFKNNPPKLISDSHLH